MRSYVGSNVGTYIENLLIGAKRYVKICSPWISPAYADRLVGLAKKGVNVWVILQIRGATRSQDKTFSISRKSFKILGGSGSPFRKVIGFFKKGKDEPLLRIIAVDPRKYEFELAHAKIYIVDGEYAIVGSANLTETALWENIEYVIVFEGVETSMIEDDYNKLWQTYCESLKQEK